MSVELGISSYIFGKIADFSVNQLLKKLDIKNKRDEQHLAKAVKRFNQYIEDRHKNNPVFEKVLNF